MAGCKKHSVNQRETSMLPRLLFYIPNNLRRQTIHNRGVKSGPCVLKAHYQYKIKLHFSLVQKTFVPTVPELKKEIPDLGEEWVRDKQQSPTSHMASSSQGKSMLAFYFSQK